VGEEWVSEEKEEEEEEHPSAKEEIKATCRLLVDKRMLRFLPV
jgi:hypothetical protein